MTKFVAIKIHYDDREASPPYLKFSRPPTKEEHDVFEQRFQDGVGGNGFHECLNFSIPDEGLVKLYLPPTCIPADSGDREDFVFFSFTYKTDADLPAHLIGVHGGATLISSRKLGIPRRDETIDGEEALYYHAESDPELTTLFAVPLPYDMSGGVFTPKFKQWGFGLRYGSEIHAKNILEQAYQAAADRLNDAGKSEAAFIERQFVILRNINAKYALGAKFANLGLVEPKYTDKGNSGNPFPAPDPEVGRIGEEFIYEKELAAVRELGLPATSVIWISRALPTMPYDIQTVRMVDGVMRDHFLEVKTSTATDPNIYISPQQIDVLKNPLGNATLDIVKLGRDKEVLSHRSLTWSEVDSEFGFLPIKYKLIAKK